LKVRVSGWAELPKADLTEMQLVALKAKLTVYPRKVGDHPGDPPGPIKLFREAETVIGVPREFFLANKRPHHEIEYDLSEGRKDLWPGSLEFKGDLRDEQNLALQTITGLFRTGTLGGILRASPGWGKTVFTTALIAAMDVPTLVLVHKEFLMKQWEERIAEFLPGAQVGFVQSDECSFQGKHIVIAMVHSLVDRFYGATLYEWPGLVVTDETHRIGASTWSQVPPKFKARWRLGITATPRRKDGAENVFFHHIGGLLFNASERRMAAKVRRVYTTFSLVKTPSLNPSLVSKNLLLKFMCANKARNQLIGEQLVLAVNAQRKILVLSERLQHLADLETMLRALWKKEKGPPPTVGYYVGGMKEEELDEAQKAQVIFATKQFAEEGLDIPALDTLFLTTPMSDIEQAAGRILRPFEGKKDPLITDFRDDKVTACLKSAESRERQYKKFGWV
jgi:superfamily II DNA or RNA helicase